LHHVAEMSCPVFEQLPVLLGMLTGKPEVHHDPIDLSDLAAAISEYSLAMSSWICRGLEFGWGGPRPVGSLRHWYYSPNFELDHVLSFVKQPLIINLLLASESVQDFITDRDSDAASTASDSESFRNTPGAVSLSGASSCSLGRNHRFDVCGTLNLVLFQHHTLQSVLISSAVYDPYHVSSTSRVQV
jgi:hypothetical protein